MIDGTVPKTLRGSLACTGLCANPWRFLHFARSLDSGAKIFFAFFLNGCQRRG
jgi:hypothetical protein